GQPEPGIVPDNCDLKDVDNHEGVVQNSCPFETVPKSARSMVGPSNRVQLRNDCVSDSVMATKAIGDSLPHAMISPVTRCVFVESMRDCCGQ
ncbi:MAG: hypothetical protein ACRDHN_16950, partial [Thermomicrobiales bacterium]